MRRFRKPETAPGLSSAPNPAFRWAAEITSMSRSPLLRIICGVCLDTRRPERHLRAPPRIIAPARPARRRAWTRCWPSRAVDRRQAAADRDAAARVAAGRRPSGRRHGRQSGGGGVATTAARGVRPADVSPGRPHRGRLVRGAGRYRRRASQSVALSAAADVLLGDFAWIYERQDQVSFLDGHVRAFAHFGGVPARLAYDISKRRSSACRSRRADADGEVAGARLTRPLHARHYLAPPTTRTDSARPAWPFRACEAAIRGWSRTATAAGQVVRLVNPSAPAAKPMMISAPEIARPAPTRSVRVGACPSMSQPDQRRRTVDPAVRGISSPSTCRVHSRQREREGDEAYYPDHSHQRRGAAAKRHPESEATRHHRTPQARDDDVGSYASIKALTNSRVPAGPVRSTNTGPQSGSTVMPNRRNRQQ